jgi:hypothetical protein
MALCRLLCQELYDHLAVQNPQAMCLCEGLSGLQHCDFVERRVPIMQGDGRALFLDMSIKRSSLNEFLHSRYGFAHCVRQRRAAKPNTSPQAAFHSVQSSYAAHGVAENSVDIRNGATGDEGNSAVHSYLAAAQEISDNGIRHNHFGTRFDCEQCTVNIKKKGVAIDIKIRRGRHTIPKLFSRMQVFHKHVLELSPEDGANAPHRRTEST